MLIWVVFWWCNIYVNYINLNFVSYFRESMTCRLAIFAQSATFIKSIADIRCFHLIDLNWTPRFFIFFIAWGHSFHYINIEVINTSNWRVGILTDNSTRINIFFTNPWNTPFPSPLIIIKIFRNIKINSFQRPWIPIRRNPIFFYGGLIIITDNHLLLLVNVKSQRL